MNKRWLGFAGAAALILGVLLAWLYYVPEPPETGATDAVMESMKEDLEQSARRVEEIAAAVRKEVTSIRGKVNSQVNSLPADDIALGLNDELARFRGVAVSSPGLDGP